jgi:hypothetical protein
VDDPSLCYRQLRIAINVSLHESVPASFRALPYSNWFYVLNVLRDILPIPGPYAWLFSETAGARGYELTTVSGEIGITLSIGGEYSSSSVIEIGGKLRGPAARLLVALSYGASVEGAGIEIEQVGPAETGGVKRRSPDASDPNCRMVIGFLSIVMVRYEQKHK